MATGAELLGQPLPDAAGEDSIRFLHALLERPGSRGAAASGSAASRETGRQENWKIGR
jgi:hypothetical protein